MAPPQVIITGRDQARASAKAAEISDTTVGMALDNLNATSIKNFARDLTARLKDNGGGGGGGGGGGSGGKLDILILSAGLFYPSDMTSGFQVTTANQQVNDALITANHLGHFHLVVNYLRPLLEASGTRVVVVTSVSHFLGTQTSVLPLPPSTTVAAAADAGGGGGVWSPLYPDGAHPGIQPSFRLYTVRTPDS